MSYSISTLLTRNLHDVFGENDPGAEEPPSTKVSPKTACSASLTGSTTAKRKLIAWPARSKQLTLTFDIKRLLTPRSWAMEGGSDGIGPTS